ncbi:hypothetical protein Tco_1231215 [Tanacetum coccineum]
MIMILKTSHHGPSDARHNPSQLLRLLSKEVCFISHGDLHAFISFPIPRSLILLAVCSSLRSPNNKSALIESDIERKVIMDPANARHKTIPATLGFSAPKANLINFSWRSYTLLQAFHDRRTYNEKVQRSPAPPSITQ